MKIVSGLFVPRKVIVKVFYLYGIQLILALISLFMGEGFVGVCMDWGVHSRRCFVINVYSK